jgi:hypothetical protein
MSRLPEFSLPDRRGGMGGNGDLMQREDMVLAVVHGKDCSECGPLLDELGRQAHPRLQELLFLKPGVWGLEPRQPSWFRLRRVGCATLSRSRSRRAGPVGSPAAVTRCAPASAPWDEERTITERRPCAGPMACCHISTGRWVAASAMAPRAWRLGASPPSSLPLRCSHSAPAAESLASTEETSTAAMLSLGRMAAGPIRGGPTRGPGAPTQALGGPMPGERTAADERTPGGRMSLPTPDLPARPPRLSASP